MKPAYTVSYVTPSPLKRLYRRAVLLAVLGGLVILVGSCAGLTPKQNFHLQKGQPNTTTYIDAKTGKEGVIYDLSGDWEAEDYHSASKFRIVQQGNQITIIAIDGTKYHPANHKLFIGTINGGVVRGQYDVYPDGWRTLDGEINREGNYIATKTYWSGGIGILNLRRMNK